VQDYADYAAALAGRYGRGGQFWRARPALPEFPVTSYEIWNEPNSALFWHPQDSAAERYADLYLAARGAIRGVDPAAHVVVGGIALENTDVTSETQFVERMYRHRPDLVDNVDAVGFHPYAATVDAVYSKLRDFRATLRRVGAPSVPLELSEVGWTTTKTPEADRAAALSRIAEELPRSDCDVERILPHTWISGEYNPSNPEHWFGIYNRDATPKPSGSAYLGAVGRMRGLGGQQPLGGSVAICASPVATAAASSQAPRGPRLRLRLRSRRLGPPALIAVTRCRAGCRLRLELLRPARGSRAGAYVAVARRVLRFSSRKRAVALRAPRKRRALLFRASATGRSGGVTTRSRRVWVRSASRR
jgi:hypothetical protein